MPFSAPAGQVTQHINGMPLDVVTCFLFLCLRVSLFFPIHSVFHFRLPLFLTQVCSWTSVHSSRQVSVTHLTGVKLKLKFFYKLPFMSHACKAKPTALKRGCGKCRSHFPIFKKECACFALLFEPLHLSYMAANAGLKAQ